MNKLKTKDYLCTGCGTCAGICPTGAIRMILNERKGFYVPQLDENKCIDCGTCYSVCPGHSVDFKALNLDIFGKEPDDVLLGEHQSCSMGHATNEAIRYNAASGGVVTALLLYAMEKGIIDGALVTAMKQDRPLEPEPFIARTKEEIVAASKSKYCPVPANVVLKEILDSKEGERFAVVGLPCHIQGIRKAERVNKKLREKIALHVGIFCSHTDTFWQTEFLLSKLGITKSDVAKIDYRGHGWPGEMTLSLKNGEEVSIPFSEAITPHNLWLHALPRCVFCCDVTSELADISCGDAWLPEIMEKEKTGKSIIIARTKIGAAVCLGACQEGRIEIIAVPPMKIKQSADMMQTKKKDIQVRFLIQKLLNKEIPDYNTTFLRPAPINYLRALLVYVNAGISSKRYLRRFIAPLSHIENVFVSRLR